MSVFVKVLHLWKQIIDCITLLRQHCHKAVSKCMWNYRIVQKLSVNMPSACLYCSLRYKWLYSEMRLHALYWLFKNKNHKLLHFIPVPYGEFCTVDECSDHILVLSTDCNIYHVVLCSLCFMFLIL